MRLLFFFIICCLTFTTVRAQNPAIKKPVETDKGRVDTLPPPAYVNQGKIEGKKAFHRALLFPGLGQMYNYGKEVEGIKNGDVQGKRIGQKIYILGKLTALYAGETLLVLSYIDNRQQYKRFLSELQFRALNKVPNPNGNLTQYTNDAALVVAKNIYKRNSQVVLISIVGLYGLGALDAYIAARLKYFNVNDDLSFKIAPSFINSNTMYSYTPAVPALKFTIKL
jgi:hypothetical protein